MDGLNADFETETTVGRVPGAAAPTHASSGPDAAIEDHDDNELLLDLLSRWEERFRRGENALPESLGVTDPAVLEALGELIKRQKRLYARLNLAEMPADGAAVADEPLLSFPDHETLGLIGQGGMGIVYKARDRKLGRVVAIKTIAEGQNATPAQRERFRAEAQAVARLRHPNIIAIHAIGEHKGRPYLSLEFAEGGSLAQEMARGPTPTHQAAELVETLARAVHAAHQAGIVHRDLKPSNVLLTVDGVPKVSDFGLAKLLDAEAELTHTGVVLGTPRYMAPEQGQARHDLVGPPTDVYALGAILAEMLAGRPVAPGCEAAALCRPVLPALRDIVARCLEAEPGRRYADAGELASELDRFRNGEPVRARCGRLRRRLGAWASRRATTATSLAALALMIVPAIALPFWTQGRVGRNAPAIAEAVRDTRADHQARTNRYVDDLRLAARLSWDENRSNHVTATMHALLDRNRPGPGEEDLRSLDWYYLWRWLHGERATLSSHKGEVFHVTYSPDGVALASAGADGVRVWDRVNRALLLTLREHRDEVNWAAFSPDGKKLATASDDRTVAVWSANDGRRLLGPLTHQHKVVAVLFTPDGKRLISGDRGGSLTVWDAQTGRTIHRLQASGDPLEGMALTPDGSVLGTAASHEVTLWDLPALQRRFPSIPADPGHRIDGVAFSHDGRRFATASGSENSVRIWDARTGALVRSLVHHPEERVMSVAFSPDDRMLISTGSDYNVRLWDLQTGSPVRTLQGHSDYVWDGTFAPDGKAIATAGKDGQVKLWTISPRPTEIPFEQSPDGYLLALAYSRDGRQLATTTSRGLCQLRDAESGLVLKTLPFSLRKPPVDAAYSPGALLVAMCDADGTITAGPPDEAEPLVVRPHVAARRPRLTFSSDGRILAFFARDGSVGRLDVTAPAETIDRDRLESPGPKPTCLAAIPGGAWAGAVEGRLLVWDQPAGRTPRASTNPAEGGIASMAISPDGTLCATGGDRSMTIWELTGLRVRAVLHGPNLPPPVRALAFSHDGRTLIAALDSGGVQLWNIATGQPILILGDIRLGVPVVGQIGIAPDDSSFAAVFADHAAIGGQGFLWRTDRTPE
jgi:eukaryotic-like serine/threonine-protein kinase